MLSGLEPGLPPLVTRRLPIVFVIRHLRCERLPDALCMADFLLGLVREANRGFPKMPAIRSDSQLAAHRPRAPVTVFKVLLIPY